MIDIHTVGAGGGSIARVDAGGALRVGPESAGANPGPVCYGKGEEITTTDANLFLGRLLPDHFLGGRMRLVITSYSIHYTKLYEILSGPAGGVVGAFETARAAGLTHVITFDMGGTSTDVSLCDGGIRTTAEASVAGFPVRVPMIDIHTVGAGGGSIARVDARNNFV